MARKDGVRVKCEDPMYALIPYIMDKRYDAMNMINLDIPLEPIRNYMKAKRNEGKYTSVLAIVIASYLRAMAEYPLLNRFVVNKKIYDRKFVDCAMVVLKPGDQDQEGTMGKMRLNPGDTIFQVQEAITSYIETNRAQGKNNSLDRIMARLLSVPGLPNVAIGLFKFLDRHGLLPLSIIDASPFHTSFTITNLASIRTNYIYHHCYEFGTTSVFMAMGNPREVPTRIRGEVQMITCLPIGVVMDERICSGHYFANVFSYMKRFLSDPSLLERSWAEEKAAQSST